ncbi:hypothetical protein [uncultured Tateyamaria sp.]|uniref:hypothetical protein n=1 Tax=uncultured Tateyamaria sp. TaxID=455651 RepID=UPI0026239E24|nr:hypothetical protein [uncultured Tateyamaria sp.]
MTNPNSTIQKLQTLIDGLDPRVHEVAIAHLQDAMDALAAASRDEPTRYARSDVLVDGRVQKKGKVRLFK